MSARTARQKCRIDNEPVVGDIDAERLPRLTRCIAILDPGRQQIFVVITPTPPDGAFVAGRRWRDNAHGRRVVAARPGGEDARSVQQYDPGGPGGHFDEPHEAGIGYPDDVRIVGVDVLALGQLDRLSGENRPRTVDQLDEQVGVSSRNLRFPWSGGLSCRMIAGCDLGARQTGLAAAFTCGKVSGCQRAW